MKLLIALLSLVVAWVVINYFAYVLPKHNVNMLQEIARQNSLTQEQNTQTSKSTQSIPTEKTSVKNFTQTKPTTKSSLPPLQTHMDDVWENLPYQTRNPIPYEDRPSTIENNRLQQEANNAYAEKVYNRQYDY